MRPTLRWRIRRWVRQDIASELHFARRRGRPPFDHWNDAEFPTSDSLRVETTVAPILGSRRHRWHWEVSASVGSPQLSCFVESSSCHHTGTGTYEGTAPDGAAAAIDAREVQAFIREAHAELVQSPASAQWVDR